MSLGEERLARLEEIRYEHDTHECAATGDCELRNEMWLVSLVDALLRDRDALAARVEALERAGATVLKGFEERVFVRNIHRDTEPGWALAVLPYIQALAALASPSGGGYICATPNPTIRLDIACPVHDQRRGGGEGERGDG